MGKYNQDIVPVKLQDNNQRDRRRVAQPSPQKLVARLKSNQSELLIYEGIDASTLKLLLTEMSISASVKGAEVSAIAYSFIETAKENGLDVYKYLNYLFEELPNIPFKEEPELLQAYLPWSPVVQEQCK